MAGEKLSLDQVGGLSKILAKEAGDELDRGAKRMAEVPDEGFTRQYRTELAVAFLYKAIVNALVRDGGRVPPEVKSSGEITWATGR